MKKDVLVIGTPIFSYTESVSKAFKLNGKESEFKIYKIPNRYLKNIPFISKIYFYWYYNIYPISFFKYCMQQAPQGGLLVLFGINYMTNEQLLKIKESRGLKIVLWFIDSIYTYPIFYRNIDVADLILCYNKSESDDLSKAGKKSFFFPMAYDQAFYYPLINSRKEYDLYFVGTLTRRFEFFEALLILLEPMNLRIRIDGPVSFIKRGKLRKNFPHLYKYSTGKSMLHDQINRFYNQSKICISIQPQQAHSGISTRTYEICGSGALQITNGNKEMVNSLFRINKEILYFNDHIDLSEKIFEIISNYDTGKYEIIASAGYEKALNSYTYKIRALEVLKLISE
jgi:spore maturation protein CgeB